MQKERIIDIKNNKPIIGITMGDPAGIGPEIIVEALNSPFIYELCNPIVFGDRGVMEMAVNLKQSTLTIREVLSPVDCHFSHGEIALISLSSFTSLCDNSMKTNFISKDENCSQNSGSIANFNLIAQFTKPSKETGRAMIEYITTAVDLAMSGDISAVVTAPINKTALKMADSPFHGHTELIAHRTATHEYAMMLAGARLKVILVTIHIPLSEVSSHLTVHNVAKTIKIARTSLIKNFGIQKPSIAVAGLNPHCGENGIFGDEENRIIIPAIKKAKELIYLDEKIGTSCVEEIDIQGPFPPDTVFYYAAQGKYDCVVCMYHDQGLIPFKLLHFSNGVNTTLGLPIVRTSVDHGTAYDIAWQNKADHTSLVEAIKMAVLQSCSLNNQS